MQKRKSPWKNAVQRERAICEMVTTLVRESEENSLPDRQRWLLARDLFQGKQDFGPERENNPSLSKVFLHEFSKIVRTAAASFQDILFQNPEFYDLKPPDGEEEDEFFRIVSKLVDYRISKLGPESFAYKFFLTGGTYGLGIAKLNVTGRRIRDPREVISESDEAQEKEVGGIRKEVEGVDFMKSLDDEALMEEGLVSALDRIFGESDGPARPKPKDRYEYNLSLRNIDPLNYFTDFDIEDINKVFWEGERRYPKLYQLQEFFDNGVLDREKKDELLKTAKGRPSDTSRISSYELEQFRKDLLPKSNPYCPVVEILEYWGPLLASGKEDGYEAGEVIEENCWFVVGNGKVLLKDSKYWSWDYKSPLFKTVFSPVPGKAIGAGIADNAIDNQLIINQIMSLCVDHLMFTILGVKAVNVDELADPEQIENGFVPGDILRVHGSRNIRDIVGDVDYNPQLAFPVMQIIEKLSITSEGSAGVDVTSANPTSRARISASEVELNSNRAQKTQFALAGEIDDTFLKELVRRVLDFVLQFDFEQPMLESLVQTGVLTESEAELVRSIPKAERLVEARRNYRVSVMGFRERLERNDFLSRLVEFVQQVNQIPESRDKVAWGELIEVFAKAFRLPVDRIVYHATPADKAREENHILANNQMVQVNPQDNHAAELQQHYQLAMSNPSEMVLSHIMMHMQIGQQSGQGFPPPPPQVAQMLGMAPEGAEGQAIQ